MQIKLLGIANADFDVIVRLITFLHPPDTGEKVGVYWNSTSAT
jgi:hypothetical protein